MPTTEFVPLIERKVIMDHSVPMTEVTLSDLRALAERWSTVGEHLVKLREGPVRYSNLYPALQALMLDFTRLLNLTIDCLSILDGRLKDHEHEFTVSLQSSPRHF